MSLRLDFVRMAACGMAWEDKHVTTKELVKKISKKVPMIL
jgi:hypothetical protein